MKAHSELTPTALRREKARGVRRAEILLAAARVFSEDGFHAASVEKIAREAGLAAGTIYLYFQDKETLYAHLFAEKVGEMVGRLEQGTEGCSDPVEAIQRCIRVHFDFHGENRPFFEMFVRARPSGGEVRQDLWERMHVARTRHIRLLSRLIAAAQRGGLIRPGSPRGYAVALIGMVVQFARDAVHEGANPKPASQAKFVSDLFFRGALCVD